MAKKGFSVEGFMADVEKFDQEINGQEEKSPLILPPGDEISQPFTPIAAAIAKKKAMDEDTLDSTPFIGRRLGNFSIPIEWLEGMATRHFREIFKHFRIVRAELDYVTQSMQYVAASDFFDEVAQGSMPGSYNISIDPGDPITIRVNRI